MKKIIYLLLISLVMVGCTKEIKFSGDEGEQYVVVMARIDPDSNICVNLSYTQFFLDDGPVNRINDADLTLWVNNEELHPQSIANGNYRFNKKPMPGDSVRFVAKLSGRPDVNGATNVITSPQISNVRGAKSPSFQFIHMMDVYDIRFQLDDVAGEKDYYLLELYEHDQRPATETDDAIDTIFKTSFIYFGPTEVGDTLPPSIDSALFVGSVLFSDQHFDGQQKDMVLMAMPVIDTAGLMQRDFYVRIVGYSEAMARYVSTRSSATSMMTIFSEPMQVYSNIEGGIGVIGSLSKRMVKVTMKNNE